MDSPSLAHGLPFYLSSRPYGRSRRALAAVRTRLAWTSRGGQDGYLSSDRCSRRDRVRPACTGYLL